VNLKIGIFDSGIGGFTILNSLLKTREDVEVFYLADTKRIPFGNKNSKEIRLIAKEICTFFVDKNLDALLIACNTTNACALDILEDNLKVPCFDLINSVSEIVDKQIIGVLATQTTVRSSYYKNAINSKKKNNFFRSTYDELKLVVWPNKQQLFSESVAVIIMVSFSAAAIASVSRFYGWAASQIFG